MDLLLFPTAIFYLLAAYVCISGLLRKTELAGNKLWLSAGAALFCHSIWQVQHLFIGPGQNLSMFNMAALLSLLIAFSATLLVKQLKLWLVLPVIYLFSVLTLFLASYLPNDYITHLNLRPQVLLHISFALAAFTVLMIASLYALQLAFIDWSLKQHKPSALHPALPPLISIEKQLFSLIQLGLLLLTVSLLTGFIFVGDLFSSGKAHKAVFACMAWLTYVSLLWGHYRLGWRGKWVAVLTICGSFLLCLAYFGSRFVREFILAA